MPLNQHKSNIGEHVSRAMPQNLYDAHRQWATRPADQCFTNLNELLDYTQRVKSFSTQENRYISQVRLGISRDGGITMNGSSSLSYFSHWAFGQMCRVIGAPASYVRTLPIGIARNCLDYGVESREQECQMLFRDFSQDYGLLHGERYVSAFTSPSYGRIWDVDVVANIVKATKGTSWHVPPAGTNNHSENSGLYASDHDMFAFLVNDDDPVEVGNARLGKGFFCWNSETGASTFGLTTFLYNYVCGNHIVWGAEDVKELKIYHRSKAPDHLYSTAVPLLNHHVRNSAVDDGIKRTVDVAMNKHVGNTLEDALDWFKAKPFTRSEITNARETGIAEGGDVTSVWGMVQGLTAYARDLPHIDKRVNLERRAGALLACSN